MHQTSLNHAPTREAISNSGTDLPAPPSATTQIAPADRIEPRSGYFSHGHGGLMVLGFLVLIVAVMVIRKPLYRRRTDARTSATLPL